jgi:hypothetical protein
VTVYISLHFPYTISMEHLFYLFTRLHSQSTPLAGKKVLTDSHYITKFRLKKPYFPIFIASHYAIAPKFTKINPAQKSFSAACFPSISISHFVISVFPGRASFHNSIGEIAHAVHRSEKNGSFIFLHPATHLNIFGLYN